MASGEGIFKRSEAVRNRRLRTRVDKPAQRRAEFSRSRAVPRMVARDPEMERQLHGNGRPGMRRRRTLQLAADGAELRLPALPDVYIGWRAVSGLLAGLMALMLYFTATSAGFVVGRIELRNNTRLSAQDVNAALRIAGSSIFSVNPDLLAEQLAEGFPELESLHVKVGFPARVVVDVVERRPVIAWQQADITVWLDEYGIAFVPEGEAQGLVTVQALEAPPALVGDLFASHQLIRREMVMAIGRLSLSAPESVTLVYDAQMGFGWQDPGGWLAFFGQDGTNIEQRLAVYNAIVADLQGRRVVPTLISVANLHAPYYRLDY